MRKMLLAVSLILMSATIGLAQNTTQTTSHDVRTETCNSEFPNGFKGARGAGESGALRVKFYITSEYKMTDLEAVRKELVMIYIDGFNLVAKENSYGTRFEGVDYDSSEEFNFLVFVNVSHNTSTDEYTIVYDVHGWGKHHLFTYSATSKGSTRDAVAAGIENLPKYFENGWSCTR